MFDTTNPVGEGASAPASSEVDTMDALETGADENSGSDETEVEYDDNGDEITPPPVEDDEEVEYEGKKFRAPKGVKDGILRQADYTQKTQALSADRKAFESARTASDNTSKAHLDALVKVNHLDNQIAGYKDVNWGLLYQQDPALAAQHSHNLAMLKEQRADADKSVSDAKAAIDGEKQRIRAKQEADFIAAAPTLVPGWSAKLDQDLSDYGTKQIGFAQDFMREIALREPKVASVLHKAYQWDQHQAKTAKAAAAQKNADVKPASTLTNNRAGSQPRDPNKMSTSAYIKMRKAQM